MMENYDDGLMAGVQPDWWDIANVYGPKAYLTILTIRAIRTYAYLSTALGVDVFGLSERLALADSMQHRLVEELWDEEAGYILNYLDNDEIDRHLYMGSLLAVVFDLVDDEMKERMLETARTELLDPNIGLRTVVPTDFHELVDRYRLVGMEAGLPGRYINGGVWPHGNAWYAMALLAAGQPDSALAALRKYYTLDGIANSPGGQPALYEYRRTDKDSPAYGELDKTTFLWAGGWYLWSLYQLAGVRENEWNIRFDPNLPAGLEAASFDLMAAGGFARVNWSGEGKYFRRISADGRPVYSAVVTGPSSVIDLERGFPEAPYLESADAMVESVSYDTTTGRMEIELRGTAGQWATVHVLTPIESWEVAGERVSAGSMEVGASDVGDGVWRIAVRQRLEAASMIVAIEFAH
jgi:cellobiose phosphorylase